MLDEIIAFPMKPQTGIRTRVWYGTFVTMVEVMPRAAIKTVQGVATKNFILLSFRTIIVATKW